MRSLPVSLLMILAPLACSAQTSNTTAGSTTTTTTTTTTNTTATTSAAPAGWTMHVDKPSEPASESNFRAMGSGFHVTNGAVAAIYFNPANTASGTYTVSGTFTQEVAPAHPEAYGLVFGGSNLTSDSLSYIYFLVRGDGSYLVKHHASNGDIHTIADWTKNAAVHAQDAAGKATNALLVKVAPDTVRYFVNGTQVMAMAHNSYVQSDGIAGVRINHHLDVHVDGFTVKPGN